MQRNANGLEHGPDLTREMCSRDNGLTVIFDGCLLEAIEIVED
jgi:hypothetical protein